MAPDHFPSGAIGFTATDYDQAPKPGDIARRSVSIFSRRGTDDQETKPVSLARTVMRPMTARQHSWLGKRSSTTSKEHSRTSSNKGTVLKAVPVARVIKMTSLEEEMATSPNEEILSAITEHPSSQLFATSNHLSSTTKSKASLRSSNSFPPKTSPRSRRRSDNDYRIGTWINGVAHFDRSAWMAKEGQTSASTLRSTMMYSTSDKTHSQDGLRSSMGDPSSRTIAGTQTPRILLQHPAPKRSYSPAQYEPASTIAAPRPLRTASSNSLPAVHDMRLLTPEARAPAQPRVASHRSNPSQSSISSRSTTDESSIYSRRSSVTTVDTIVKPEFRPSTSSSSFTPLCPAQAGVFDDISPHSSVSMDRPVDIYKTLPPPPAATPTPPATQTAQTPPVPTLCVSRSVTKGHHSRGSSGSLLSSRSMTELSASAQSWYQSGAASPTLSQAENAVHSQLSAMGEQRSSWHSVDGQINEQHLYDQALKRKDSVGRVMQPPQRAPTLPKRSRKREWRVEKTHSMPIQEDIAQRVPVRSRSTAQLVDGHSAKPAIPLRKMASISHFPDAPTKMAVLPQLPSLETDAGVPERIDPTAEDMHSEASSPASPVEDFALSPASSNSAEAVLLQILGSLPSLNDLFNTAIINKGMYRVYKAHEMHLLQTVLRNQSPAAYEFRELRQSKDDTKATPQSYIACHRSDLAVIERLKRLVHEKCQSFLRRETLFALSTPTHPNAQRFDDAFWRIWCFCAMFSPGHQKGREDDITGQLDWLKGGLVNENHACAATVNTNLEFDVASVLLNSPEHFAIANRGGLSTSQLWDLTEIWNCYKVMLSGYSGRIEQAREYGIFDECDVPDGDIETEERLLEDWLTYVLTLGTHAVLDLALLASDPSPAGFALAKQYGWTQWTLPTYSNSLSNFLKEPVAIVYSEQVTAAKQRLQDPQEQQQKELSRKRVASMAAEIRLRRQSSEYKRLPLIDMKSERAMSVVSRCDSAASMRSAVTTSSSWTRSSQSSTSSSSRTATSYKSPAQSIGPIPEDRCEYAESDASSQSGASTFAENSSEVATMKLVSMGFPITAARQALRITDDGESLRLDRAVEYLLRQR